MLNDNIYEVAYRCALFNIIIRNKLLSHDKKKETTEKQSKKHSPNRHKVALESFLF